MTKPFRNFSSLIPLCFLGMCLLFSVPSYGAMAPARHEAREQAKEIGLRNFFQRKGKKQRSSGGKKVFLIVLTLIGVLVLGTLLTAVAFFSTLGLGLLGGIAIFTAGWGFLLWSAVKIIKKILKKGKPSVAPNLSPR